MIRKLTREEQDQQEDLSLNNINMRLKKNSPRVNNKKPIFNECKNYKPKELIKASFYLADMEPKYLFNALLYDIPEKESAFKIENDIYIVKSVTRNLIKVKPGAFREVGIDILVNNRR